jgi:hypothetical protein
MKFGSWIPRPSGVRPRRAGQGAQRLFRHPRLRADQGAVTGHRGLGRDVEGRRGVYRARRHDGPSRGANGGLYRLTATHSTLVSCRRLYGQLVLRAVRRQGCLHQRRRSAQIHDRAGTGAALGGSPPTCQYPGIVRDFVFLAGNSSNQNRVYWSAIDNAEGWTIGTNQSRRSGLARRRRDYRTCRAASSAWRSRTRRSTSSSMSARPRYSPAARFSNSIGALCHGSIAQHGRQTFFYSRRGFYKFVDGEVADWPQQGRSHVPHHLFGVGDRRTFAARSIPNARLVIWSMPDRLWVYNFENDMWSDVARRHCRHFDGRTASLTLEDIAVIYPSIEDVTPTFDDPFWRGGEPMLLIAKTDGKLYSFGASGNLEARSAFPQLEPNPGAFRTSATAASSATAPRLRCRSTAAHGWVTAPLNVVSIGLPDNGEVPIRASGFEGTVNGQAKVGREQEHQRKRADVGAALCSGRSFRRAGRVQPEPARLQQLTDMTHNQVVNPLLDKFHASRGRRGRRRLLLRCAVRQIPERQPLHGADDRPARPRRIEQVNSQFEQSGRYGSGAHADVLSRNLLDANGQLMYQNYGDEMNRMGQAAQGAQAGKHG